MDRKTIELIQKAAVDIFNSQYAISLTGAGISTESGIPDFRGPSGVWTKNPEAEKKAYDVYQDFIEDPKGWWEGILSSPEDPVQKWTRMNPNPGHTALTRLEKMGLLKCTITQNVDGLHEKSGTKNLYEYHGSALKLRCVSCNERYGRDDYDLNALKETGQLPPKCGNCKNPLKSDIVFFGEGIPLDVAMASEEETEQCDLMLICGTSAVVYPFAGLPLIARYGSSETQFGYRPSRSKPKKVTIIEVNAEPTPLTEKGVSDYLIQGKTGEILPAIVEEIKTLKA